ncbi:hypothetical protein TNCV_4442681 [Trichonephila clavipes]|nr:hypothetical protein TNCV_4442681 [Trichonephila clavipes]
MVNQARYKNNRSIQFSFGVVFLSCKVAANPSEIAGVNNLRAEGAIAGFKKDRNKELHLNVKDGIKAAISKIMSASSPNSLTSETFGPRHGDCGKNWCRMVKISDHGWLVTSSSPVPLKTRCVGERCTLNVSRAQSSFRWCSVVVRRGVASSGVILVT